ncbi:uncharacterized mitochondrial protein-like protein [Tanacetum coccineum]
MTSRRLFKLLQSFRICLRKGCWFGREADSELRLKGVLKNVFKTCCMNWGEVNPVHAYYNGSRTSKDNEDPSWNTSQTGVNMPRMKLDSEFTPEETNRENADTQAEIILSQGRTLQQRKEDLFDEFERFRAIGNEPIHDYFVRFHQVVIDMKITQLENSIIAKHQGGQHQPHLFQQSHILKPHPAVLYPNDALMATMEILIEKSFKWFPEAVSSYHNQLRRAPGNVGNTGSRGNQSYGNVTTATGKKVICYNCRGEGHVARQCKEPKRAKDSQYFKDKMLLMEAKEKGVTLDAEMKLPRQYGNDVDEGPNDCTAAFIGEICNHTSGNNHHVNESLLTITTPYHQLELERRAKVVPTEVSTGSSANISMVTILDEMRDTLDEKTQENQDLSLENQNLTAELAKCKLEIVRLDTQQVKLDLERQVRQEQNLVTQRNERNAELEQEKVMLKTHLKSKDVSIEFLKSKNQKVLTDKKKLEDKYLDEIVCLKSANKVATDLLQKFQMPTHTIPMLSKKPKNASQDLHKDILGRSNPRYGKKAPVINASNAWDTDETLASAEVSMAKMKGKPGHVRPESGFYEKLNALKFVPQQELSREQVYWLPANEIASQASTPATPVTPYVPKSPPPSQGKPLKVVEIEAEILKKQQMLNESEKHCAFIEKNHVNLQVKFQKHKECLQNQRVCDNINSTASNAIFEINKLKDQLQEKDDTIRNLQTQINITRMLNVGSTVGSFDKQALETELSQLKDALTLVRIQLDSYKLSGKISSGFTASEKPKVLASGMYTNSSKYIPPPKRANWVKSTPLPKKKQVTFQEPPKTSNRPTQKPPVQQNKKPNVSVNLVNARRAAYHNRKLNVVDHNQFVIHSLKSVNTKTPQAKHSVNHTKKVWKATRNHNVNTTKTAWRPTGKVVGSVKPQWKPTGRHFALYDNCPLTRIMEPIVEPLELTPSVSSSSKVTMISRFTDCKLSDRKAGSKGISGIFEC